MNPQNKKKGIHLCRELIWTKSLQSRATKSKVSMIIFYSTIRFASMPSSNLWQLNLHINLYCKLIWSVVQCFSLMYFLRNTHFITVNGQEYNIFLLWLPRYGTLLLNPKNKIKNRPLNLRHLEEEILIWDGWSNFFSK